MSYVAQILRGAKGAGSSPALPKPMFADGVKALSGALGDSSGVLRYAILFNGKPILYNGKPILLASHERSI
jgi:hypothetical protein